MKGNRRRNNIDSAVVTLGILFIGLVWKMAIEHGNIAFLMSSLVMLLVLDLLCLFDKINNKTTLVLKIVSSIGIVAVLVQMLTV